MEVFHTPFNHAIIPDFIPERLLSDVVKEYDRLLEERRAQWVQYQNPLEYKLAYNAFVNSAPFEALKRYVSEESFVQQIQQTFHLENIELDTAMYGAGLHNHPSGGFLSTHLDYEIHPQTLKKRWINLLIYLNDDWKPEYNGDTELWNPDCTRCEKRIYPEYNKALLFQTDNLSWHGVSRPIQCPPTTSRKTVAFYYVSKRAYDVHEFADPSQIRWKAKFHHVDYPELCHIRSQRTLVPEDYSSLEK